MRLSPGLIEARYKLDHGLISWINRVALFPTLVGMYRERNRKVKLHGPVPHLRGVIDKKGLTESLFYL